MKILICITSLARGGAERQVCDLADSFTEMGHEVIIYSFMPDILVLPLSKDVRVYNGNLSKHLLSFVLEILKFVFFVFKNKPNIIHSHLFHANVLSRFSRILLLNTKLICSIHNTQTGGLFREHVYRFTDMFCNLTTNVSKEALLNHINKNAIKKKKSVHVYNGFNIDRFNCKSVTSGRFGKFIAAGSLTKQKNFKGLIESFVELVKYYPNSTLDIAGEGDEKKELQGIIDLHHLNEHVRLIGFKSNLPQLMQDYDYFVLSSLWEGFVLVLPEAMLTGLPVLATNCGGVSEAMCESKFLIPKDDKQALINGMKSLLELDDSEYENIQNKGRAHIKQYFNIEKITNQWLGIYQAVIDGKPVCEE